MRYNGNNLKEVLGAHKRWFFKLYGWTEDDRANLCNANLHGADLHGAYLCGAYLCGAYLRDADLHGAYLCGAYLCDADLCNANLHGAYLCGAYLCGADLCNADLCNANLHDANLRNANLRNADLHGADNIPFIPMACPDSGAFVGWKKCKEDKIVKLLIPEDARRLSATGRKCRCDKAIVLSVEHPDGTEDREATCLRNDNFVYRVGETVSVDDFDDCRWNECSTGIHFFINRQEAVNYML